MIYSLVGEVTYVYDDFLVIETSGIGFRVRGTNAFCQRAHVGKKVRVFCYWQSEQAFVYGFSSPDELSFFEFLITVPGIGPKMGLKLLNNLPPEQIASYILLEKRDELSKSAGISSKTASKIIIELKEKIRKSSFSSSGNREITRSLELEEMLRLLGYPKKDIQEVCGKIDLQSGRIEDHLKHALKELSSYKIRNISV